jgi:hypothetical protein
MKKATSFLATAVLFSSLALPALAQAPQPNDAALIAKINAAYGTQYKANGKVSAMMMADGDVVMKVKVPPAEYAAMIKDESNNHNTCMLMDLPANQTDTIVLVCSPNS